jgi:DNA replication protein DnaC
MESNTLDPSRARRMAYALIYLDKHTPAMASREIGCSEAEVVRYAQIEHEAMCKDASPSRKQVEAPSVERYWREIGQEPATCDMHGPYVATWMRMHPEVEPHAAHAKMKPHVFMLGPRPSSCPACDAALQSLTDIREAEIRGGMSADDQRERMRLEQANIPRRYYGASISNWLHPTDQQDRVWRWAADYADACDEVTSSGRSAVLVGSTGTGKTHLAIGVLRHFMKQGATGYYTTAIDMLGRIKATYNSEAEETESKAVGHLTSVDLLVIDEIGRQLDTSYEVAQLFRVIDRRSADMRPTLLISNLGVAALKAFCGEHIVDRLAQNGGKVLQLDWPSHRRRAKQ